MLWTIFLSSVSLNSSSMRSQIKAELEAVARSLFHSPRTNSLKASPVCAQIKSLMNIFAKHQKSGWRWSSAQPRPWRFGWKDSAATRNGARGLQSCGDTASSCHCSGVTVWLSLYCPGRNVPGRGHSQGWVLQAKGENLQGCSARGQTPDRLPHGERKDPGHCTPGRRSQGAVMGSWDTSVVLQVCLCHMVCLHPRARATRESVTLPQVTLPHLRASPHSSPPAALSCVLSSHSSSSRMLQVGRDTLECRDSTDQNVSMGMASTSWAVWKRRGLKRRERKEKMKQPW